MREARLIKGYEKVFHYKIYQIILLRVVRDKNNLLGTDLFFI